MEICLSIPLRRRCKLGSALQGHRADPQGRVRFAKTGVLELDGLAAQFVSIEDSFVHLGGASYFKQYESEMLRQDISQALRKRIAAARPG